MANRFQVNQHRVVYNLIASRDGEYCLICKRGPDKVKLQIDHADNNTCNLEGNNLHLLCQEHNLQFRGMPVAEKLRIIEEHSAKNVCVLERKYGSISSKVAKDKLDYESGSVEMKANSMFEPVFNEWLMKNLPMSKSEAIHSGAYIVGCSPATCERYLKKLTCAAGPLQEYKNAMNVMMVDLKDELKQPSSREQQESGGGGSNEDSASSSNASEEAVSAYSASIDMECDKGVTQVRGDSYSVPSDMACSCSVYREAVFGSDASREAICDLRAPPNTKVSAYKFRPPQSEIRN